LRKCDSMRDARERVAYRYNLAFAALEQLEIPVVSNDRRSAWHLYPIRIHPRALQLRRDELIGELRKRGVGTSVHFIPLHLHPYYQKKFGYKIGDFPYAEREYQRYISLPIFPTMKEEHIEHVVKAVSEVAGACANKYVVNNAAVHEC